MVGNSSETLVKKTGLGISGILVGFVFVIIILLILDYFNVINLPLTIFNSTGDKITGIFKTTKKVASLPRNLINNNITIQDVRASKIEFGDIINKPLNVPDRLRSEATKKGITLIYVGANNKAKDNTNLDGNELNDCLFYTKSGATFNGSIFTFGGISNIEGISGNKQWVKIGMELADKPIIPISNSNDFYIYDQTRKIFVRVVRDEKSRYQQTLLNYVDLAYSEVFDNGTAPQDGDSPSELYKNRERHKAGSLNEKALIMFFNPGSAMGFYIQQHDSSAESYGITDEYGVPVARLAWRLGYAGIDKIKNLF
jgi:hypothetical protein